MLILWVKKNNRNLNMKYFTNVPKYLFAMISHNDCITMGKVQYDENKFWSFTFTAQIKHLKKKPVTTRLNTSFKKSCAHNVPFSIPVSCHITWLKLKLNHDDIQTWAVFQQYCQWVTHHFQVVQGLENN